jgi:hypothetical protein
MKKTFAILSLITFLLITASFVYASEPVNYGYELTITPSAEKEDVYTCKAVIKDLDGDKVFAEPSIITSSGKEAKIEIGDENFKITITVLVNKETSTAEYTIETSKEKKVVSYFKGSIKL